ncbi:MAG TPA: hypothetical protein VLB44_16335 [Kofleriaceae bacterium]|nr:hypothetical protein [Kofleriaceae bacterium]
MTDSLRPTEGARFLLEREQDAGSRADYRVAIYTPDATYTGRASLADDGSVSVEAAGASEDLLAMLTMLAKLTARSAAKKREDGLPPWPQRVLRWRGPGRGE